MVEESSAAGTPDVMDMFDDAHGPAVVCRVCGSMVAGTDEYRRAHWDWHEAPNGA